MTYSAAKVTFFFHPIRQFLCRKLVILCQIPKPSFWQRGSVKHLDQINVYQRHILHFLLLRVQFQFQFQSWNEKELKRDVLSCRLSNTLIETCPSPRFMILAGFYRNVPFLYVTLLQPCYVKHTEDMQIYVVGHSFSGTFMQVDHRCTASFSWSLDGEVKVNI